MSKRKIHPLADLYPMLPEPEFQAMKASVKTHGLQEPVLRHKITREILDGRNRLRALDELGLRPKYRDVEGDPVVLILAANERRRHMSPTQRLAIAAAAGISKPPCGSDRQWDRACKLHREHPAELARVAKDGTLDLTYNRLYPEERTPRAKPQQPAALVETMKLRDSIKRLKKEQSTLVAELGALRRKDDVMQELSGKPLEPVRRYELQSGRREACAVVLLSDLHPEENVNPETIPLRDNGEPWNRYNLAIADLRMRRAFAGAEWLIRKEQNTFDIRHMMLWLGGDLITGHLHDENVETNQLGPTRAILWTESRIVAGIDRLLASDLNLERIDIPCSGGNHGRSTYRVRAATWYDHSWEWMLYQNIAQRYKDEPRVRVLSDKSEHQYHTIYDFRWHGHHGHRIGYGGGVGGVTIPLIKKINKWDEVRRCDLHDFGHFHQYLQHRNFAINGSLIGYNAYAMSIGAAPEEPRQSFYLIDSKRGKTACCPIWVGDPSAEADLWKGPEE